MRISKNLLVVTTAISALISIFISAPASVANSYGNPVIHSVTIDDDQMIATISWSTMPTSDDDDIDDYAYTTDGFNFTSLFGAYNSSAESESQTLTLKLPARANAKTQIYAIGKVRDNRITAISNIVKTKINEQPIPVYVSYVSKVGSTLNYKITNYNAAASASGAIKYKISQIKVSPGSKVRISLSDDLIQVQNYTDGEKLSFRLMKYVNLCDGFSPYLSCPYNSKRDVTVS
jgi:hypothetical protein